MNLVELYQQIPIERHDNDIRVVGDRVFVRGTDGYIDEYVLSGQELWLVRSDRQLMQDIVAIKTSLGI